MIPDDISNLFQSYYPTTRGGINKNITHYNFQDIPVSPLTIERSSIGNLFKNLPETDLSDVTQHLNAKPKIRDSFIERIINGLREAAGLKSGNLLEVVGALSKMLNDSINNLIPLLTSLSNTNQDNRDLADFLKTSN